MTTHIEVTKRAVHGFRQMTNVTTLGLDLEEILKNYQPYLQAGAYFPDWGYSCANQSESSELAHWPPFWNASVQYFHSNYKKPYTNEAKAFIAFLFGMVSHGVADAPWHSLDAEEGFIRASQETEFRGSYAKAHTNADFGGEMVLAHSSHLSGMSLWWNVPTDALYKIYAQYKLNVTAFQLRICMLQGYVATQGIRLAGKLILPVFAAKSPFLVKEYRDYFRGGVMDMAAWVIHCWHYLERWLQDGPHTPFCKTVDLEWTPGKSKKAKHDQFLFDFRLFLGNFALTFPSQDTEPDQVVINVTKKYPRNKKKIPKKEKLLSSIFQELKLTLLPFLYELGTSFWRQVKNLIHRPECVSSSKAAYTFEFDEPFARFGKSLAHGDFHGDGAKKLVISTPYLGGDVSDAFHTGAVWVMKSNLSSNSFYDNVHQIIRLPKDLETPGQRFGYALAVVDLNCDGIDDLAISAPSANSLKLHYSGSVFVFFGNKDKGFGSYPDVVIEPNLKQPHHKPGQTWENQFVNLGEHLYSFDLDGDSYADLVIASPHSSPLPGRHQIGEVHVFESSSRHNGRKTLSDSDWSLAGIQDYEWFGSSVAFSSTSNASNSTIFIGSSGYRNNATDVAQGRIYGFELRKDRSPFLKFAVTSDNENSRFGGSMAVGDFGRDGMPTLAISSPAEKNRGVEAHFSVFPGLMIPAEQKGFQAGTLRVINVTSLSSNRTVSSNCSFLTSVVFGSHSFGHFGDSLFKGERDSLWVSEPLWHQETGRVYMLTELSSETTLNTASANCYQGTRGLQRFGSSILVADINHDGRLDLVLSSMNGKLEESGVVQVFFQ